MGCSGLSWLLKEGDGQAPLLALPLRFVPQDDVAGPWAGQGFALTEGLELAGLPLFASQPHRDTHG